MCAGWFLAEGGEGKPGGSLGCVAGYGAGALKKRLSWRSRPAGGGAVRCQGGRESSALRRSHGGVFAEFGKP